MADIAKLQTNFLRFGTPFPSFLERAKSLIRFKKDNFIPSSTVLNYGFGSIIPDSTKINSIKEGWNKSATVYAIVRKIAKTCAYAPWQAYKIVDDQAYKKYKSLASQTQTNKSIGQLQIAKVKALEPIQDNRLNDLYSNPNPLQSGSEYIEALITYKLLTGDSYEWANMLDLGRNSGTPGELWPLPSHLMQIIHNGSFPLGIKAYILADGNQRQFTPEEVLHTKYFNPNYSFLGTHLYGFSPLQASWLTVQEDNDAKQAGIEILQSRGPRKIITVETDAIRTAEQAAEQAGRLQKRWREQMIENKGGLVLMPGKGGSIDVGLGINDLKILEISNYTQDDLCNVYGVWSGLFNSQSNQKYDNVNQFRKDFIINTVLPELNQLRDARNYKLRTDWGYKNAGIVLDYDPTVYAELQEDFKELATWLKMTDWFTPNEKRAYMNEPPIDNPAMDRVYIPTNYAPIDEIGMEVMPLPKTGLENE